MKIRRLIAATFLAALATAVAATPAEAGKKHHGHGGHHGRHAHHGQAPCRVVHRAVPHRPVVVPYRIAVHAAPVYDPYYDGRVWSAPHRHYHAVYTFPVRLSPGMIAYAPHTYCDGHLLVRGDVVLDRYGYDDGQRYRWDDRVSGYIAFGGPNVAVRIGF